MLPSKASKDYGGLKGKVDDVPDGNKTYFVYTFNLDEWDELRAKFMKLPNELLDDELLKSCMEDRKHLDSFVQSVYWHQLCESNGSQRGKNAVTTFIYFRCALSLFSY